MNLSEAIKKAWDKQDGELACHLAEGMRWRLGMNYREMLARVKKEGIDGRDWDALLCEGDSILSRRG